MTRFMMTLGEAVDLVLFAFEHGHPGDIFVQKSPTASLDILAKALTSLLGVPDHKIRILGTRHGEKLFETLLSREEMFSAQDLGDYFRVPPDLRDLNYSKYMDQGETQISEAVDYNSHNASQLNVDEMKALLMKLPFMQAVIRGDDAQAEE
jgi:UDP-glucose 4-epimerase